MTTPVPGWYPEPSGAPGERWWNGASWTDDVRPPAAPPAMAPPAVAAPVAAAPADAPHGWDGFGNPAGAPPAVPAPGYGTPTPPPMYATTPQPTGRPASWVSRNGYSLGTVAVVVVYLLILAFAHIVFLGLLPLLLGFRAVGRREPLAWPAVVISVAAVVFGIYQLVH